MPTFGQVNAQQGATPPVYDPGGPTWVATGAGSREDFRAALEAARAAGAAQLVVPGGEREVLEPLGFEAMSDFWAGTLDGSGAARPAARGDLPRMLDLAAARRAAYAQVQPVFWREAEDARERQRSWFEHLLAAEGVRTLIEDDGFLIATPRDGRLLVDDFAVADAEAWDGAGRGLLSTLDGPVTVICACHDKPKQALMRTLGLEPAFTWFQRGLR